MKGKGAVGIGVKREGAMGIRVKRGGAPSWGH